ncbi:thiamine transporter 1 domain protein [Onchocerca flexuosa]|uniref:Thiamine transporter 1 domain protein n=1 Tax=Onchocerca flexuosa TaxID=387005 RepID=A0A238C150_9BILA|nr:thiamine transporter 1 domain protein [Onchocerca flexuosa]
MWRFLTALICFYGFIKEFKLGEPFIYLYQSEVLNLTREQLTNEVYPFTAYSYLLSLIPVLLLTDLTLYKPTMLLEVVGQAIYRCTLVFFPAVWAQKLGMMIYGTASASEIAFFSYIYAKSEKDQYQKLTSYSRAAVMSGRMISYLLAQAIILTGIGSNRSLQYIGFGIPCFVVILALFLPSVQWKQVVIKLSDSINKEALSEQSDLPETYSAYVRYQLRLMRHNIPRIYRIAAVRKWSLWWAVTTCMSLQVAQYAQSLWGEVQHGDTNSLNGFAEAAYTATAVMSILILGLAKINWDKWGELTLALISSIDTLILIIYSQAQSIWIMYACYIGYRSLYQVMITIAQWNLARKMIGGSYGLVFGLNSFIALLLQSLLTIVVPDRHGLNMPVREQFLVYAGCHSFIGAIFLISLCYSLVKSCKSRVFIHTEQSKKQILQQST